MARFITRVELHNANFEDYQTLHAAMEARGFSRTIQDNTTRIWYHLPTAEYYIEANLPRSEVLDLAKAAAATTRKSFMAITTESNGITWYNLPEVRR